MASSSKGKGSEEKETGLGLWPKITAPIDPDNCVKVLVATDNHVGYGEGDPIRGSDSIETFIEILQLAKDHKVDMILLAGDLFHENRPSRTSLYQTIAALREAVLGRDPVSLEPVVTDGFGIARHASWATVNYEDENLNVGLPVFSIHGNHDDPQGGGSEGALCALDVLAAAGLINYFGRVELPGAASNQTHARDTGMQIPPVLLRKGDTKLGLYGLGNVRDERFNFELNSGRIRLFRPSTDPDDWFNIMLIHQNRVAHAKNNFMDEAAFPDELDLVIWGHEHDCVEKARPCAVESKKYRICQPGSSIATSLAKGEAIPKHVSLLTVQGKEYEMKPLRLRTVRPFLWDEVVLHEEEAKDPNLDLSSKVKVNAFLKKRVNTMIKRAKNEWAELHGGQEATDEVLPLIRIRVDYSTGPDGSVPYEVGNPQRFGQDFVGVVANPKDIVQFHRKTVVVRGKRVEIDQPEAAGDQSEDGTLASKVEKVQISTLVDRYLGAQHLELFGEDKMMKAVDAFVDKGDRDAIKNYIQRDTKRQVKSHASSYTHRGDETGDKLTEQISKNREGETQVSKRSKAPSEAASDSDVSMNASESSVKASTSRATRKSAPRAKSKTPMFNDLDSDSDSSVQIAAPSSKAPTRAGTSRAASSKAKAKAQEVPISSSDSDSDEPQPASKRRKR